MAKTGYLPMNNQDMHNLFQLINAMYEYRSIILTTNKEFTHWRDFFFDDNVAVPIVDRIIHHSHIFMLGGESYRLKSKLSKVTRKKYRTLIVPQYCLKLIYATNIILPIAT